MDRPLHLDLVATVARVVGVGAGLFLGRYEIRRRFVGYFQRKLRWEFWSPWAAYLPVVPYFIWLAIRHRSFTVFTAANPGIPSGGLLGESKSAILRHLGQVPGVVPEFTVIPAGGRAGDPRPLPIVLKPDVGERGNGVRIVRTETEAEAYLASATTDTIAQRYVPGLEFGVYYVRYPDEACGQVLYITEKQFPSVVGDGRASLRQLILRDSRAIAMAAAHFAVARRPLDSVPAAGESIQLVEIGSHCRGTIFLNGSHLITPELTAAIDRVSQAHPGFHLGRYDIRASSVADLRRGLFQVIELNGVSAEATHIYDPAVSLIEAYRVMFRHWRSAFEIGAIHRERGIQPMTVAELVRLLFPNLFCDAAAPNALKHAA